MNQSEGELHYFRAFFHPSSSISDQIQSQFRLKMHKRHKRGFGWWVYVFANWQAGRLLLGSGEKGVEWE